MIKLVKRENKIERFYNVVRTKSVSPDYQGLQVTYGVQGTPGKTVFYWFKSRKKSNGKNLSARVQMQRKLQNLVLRRLRNGYHLKRKCDPWCKQFIEASIERSQQPAVKRKFPKRPPKERVWERHQMSFDFNA